MSCPSKSGCVDIWELNRDAKCSKPVAFQTIRVYQHEIELTLMLERRCQCLKTMAYVLPILFINHIVFKSSEARVILFKEIQTCLGKSLTQIRALKGTLHLIQSCLPQHGAFQKYSDWRLILRQCLKNTTGFSVLMFFFKKVITTEAENPSRLFSGLEIKNSDKYTKYFKNSTHCYQASSYKLF